jgi:hypothetical protein
MQWLLRVAGAGALALLSLQATAQADDASVLRLAALVTQALPVDMGLQRSLGRDPRWPLMDRSDKVQPAELQCLRARLAPEEFRKMRLEQSRQFTRQHPDKVPDSLRVLQQGGAEVLAAMLVVTIRPGQDAAAVAADITKRFTREQLEASAELLRDARHKQLREVMGIPDDFTRNRQGNEPLLSMIARSLLVAAMDQCKVPLAVIQ